MGWRNPYANYSFNHLNIFGNSSRYESNAFKMLALSFDTRDIAEFRKLMTIGLFGSVVTLAMRVWQIYQVVHSISTYNLVPALINDL